MRRIRLKPVREDRLLTQQELADRVNMSRVAIARIEAGRPARLSTIRKLATALDISPDELFLPREEGDE